MCYVNMAVDYPSATPAPKQAQTAALGPAADYRPGRFLVKLTAVQGPRGPSGIICPFGKNMKFGLFQSVQLPDPNEQVRYYREAMAQVRHAEQLGFDSVWITEHHFPRHGIVSATLSLLAYLAGVTEKIRLGTGVTVTTAPAVSWLN